jgi:hypothetical protein
MSAETALAVVDMLSDRKAAEGSRGLTGLPRSRDSSSTSAATRAATTEHPADVPAGTWNAATTTSLARREAADAARVQAAAGRAARQLGTASNAEALALKFRTHAIGPIVGETTAGMASGGASAERLSDGSMLWFSERAIESLDGKTFEGRGVEPDVAVATAASGARGRGGRGRRGGDQGAAVRPRRPPQTH